MDIKPNSSRESENGEAGEAFYNVMPQDMSGPQVMSDVQPAPAEPAVATTTEADMPEPIAEDPHQFAIPHHHSSRKAFMIMGLVGILAVLGVFGYFGYRYAQQQNNSEEEPLAATNTNQQQDDAEDVKSGVTTPAEWQKRYFSSEECLDMNVCADAADPDRDGLSNLEEYDKKTDPNNPDSDADGLADGDEVHVFGGSPLTNRTNSSEEYLDSDYAKGGYDITTNVKFSETQLKDIKTRIKDKGLHQPTIKTLGAEYLKQYDFVDPAGGQSGDSSSVDSSLDQSPTGKLNRDTSRADAIQKIAAGLVKYKAAKGSYPATTDFGQMVTAVRPYITVATKFEDPINKEKYVYGYVSGSNNQDFTLLYFSETQNLVIKYTAQQAELDAIKANASANDDKRKRDLEHIAYALGLYSSVHVDVNSNQTKVFPPNDYYKSELVPRYLTALPTDPRTGQDYVYDVGDTFDTFTLKATYDNPPKGVTGYMCNQDECKNY